MVTPRELLAKYTTQAQMSSFFIDKMGIIDVKSSGVVGDGVTDDYLSLFNASAAAESNGGTIFFPTGTYRISTNITFPSNVVLWFANGAKLSPDAGITVTIYGSIIAGLHQIFTGSGFFAGTIKNETAYPQWFGASGDGVTDDKTALTNFLKFCDIGKVKGYIPDGTYMLSATLARIIENGLDIELSKDTTISAMVGFTAGKFIFFEDKIGTTNKKYLYWKGGTLDAKNVPASLAGQANDTFYIAGHNTIDKSEIKNIIFTLYPDYVSSDTFETVTLGGDSHLFIAGCKNVIVEACQFYFTDDSAIYISGGGEDLLSEYVKIDSCVFYECKDCITSKRQHKKYIAINNFINRCELGITQSNVGDAITYSEEGTEVIISHNFIERCSRGIELRDQTGGIVDGNFIQKIGYKATASYPVGILISGGQYCNIINNFIDGTDGQAATHISAINNADHVPGNVAKGNIITGNIFKNISRGIEHNGEQITVFNYHYSNSYPLSDYTGVNGIVVTDTVVEFYSNGIKMISSNSAGNVIMPNLPTTTAGLPAGAIWKDTGAANVLKIV